MAKSASHAEMHNTYYARALCPNNMLRLPVTNANWQITATRFWNRNRQKYQEMDRKYQKLFHSEWQQVKCRAVTTETKAWHLKLWRRGTFAILFLLFPCFWKIKRPYHQAFWEEEGAAREDQVKACAHFRYGKVQGADLFELQWGLKSVIQSI